MQPQTKKQLEVIYQSYSTLVKQALIKGLFTDTNQVIICHNDLAVLKKVIDESEQQTGKDPLDSGNGATTVRKNRKTIPKKETKATEGSEGQGSAVTNGVTQLSIPD